MPARTKDPTARDDAGRGTSNLVVNGNGTIGTWSVCSIEDLVFVVLIFEVVPIH